MKTRLSLKIVPGSSRNSIVGKYGDCLKIKLAAPPEKGRANQALLKLLSEQLQLPLSSIVIVSGHTNAIKVVEIEGLEEEIFLRLSLK